MNYTSIIPVIHYLHHDLAIYNAAIAFSAGCDGVMLIEMHGNNRDLPHVANEIAILHPNKIIGVNWLNMSTATEIDFTKYDSISTTWTDEQLTHSLDAPWLKAQMTATILKSKPGHLLFSAVDFKYQSPEPNPTFAAIKALEFGFIPTTSGTVTGMAPNLSKIISLRNAIGPHAPLAIASGITLDNALSFLPFVSHILVSTGISSSFHEFDPRLLKELVKIRNVFYKK